MGHGAIVKPLAQCPIHPDCSLLLLVGIFCQNIPRCLNYGGDGSGFLYPYQPAECEIMSAAKASLSGGTHMLDSRVHSLSGTNIQLSGNGPELLHCPVSLT